MGPAGHANPYYVTTQGYFFHVPQEVEEFGVWNIHSARIASLWDPDGGLAWENRERGPGAVTLAVPPQHRGRLWRLRGTGFVMDAKIPPYYAIDADRWFDHGPYPAPEYPTVER